MARLLGGKSPRNPLDRAKELLAGGQIGAVDPKDDIKACDEESFDVLKPAIMAATRHLDDVSAELSFQASRKVQPQYREALMAVLRGLEELIAAAAAAATVPEQLRQLGFTPNQNVLPPGVPFVPAALDPNNVGNSAPWFWKRKLAELGLL
jgi:hypothetical protein